VSPGSPLVSIVIPVFNGADYLREAIDSALAQTHRPVEVLVVNDGSRDGGATEAVARSYGERIRYLAKENGGVASALNLGIEAMRGEWFSWLSHDDLYLPRKLEVQLARAAALPEDAVLFSDYRYVDPSGRPLRDRRIPRVRSMRVALLAGDPVHGCTVLVPRRCFDRVGRFDESLRTTQDYDLWFRMADHFPFVHVPVVLVLSRVHPAQGIRTISTHRAETQRTLARFLQALRAEEIASVHAGHPSRFYATMALRMKMRGFDDVARAALEEARARAAGAGSADHVHRWFARAACALLSRRLKPSNWFRRGSGAGP